MKAVSGTEFDEWLATLAEVTWNGCGRPSGCNATASPSITAESAWVASVISTSSGTRSVMSSRVLVNTRTRCPDRCSCTRMPSIFHSSAAGHIRSSAALMLGAEAASMGRTGCPTRSVNARSALITSSWLPSPRAAASAVLATSGSDPRSWCARRTSATGTPAALATASAITPSSAPCRRSPASNLNRNCRSLSPARPISSASRTRRAAVEPGPVCAPIDSNAASVWASVSDARSAAPPASATPAATAMSAATAACSAAS